MKLIILVIVYSTILGLINAFVGFDTAMISGLAAILATSLYKGDNE